MLNQSIEVIYFDITVEQCTDLEVSWRNLLVESPDQLPVFKDTVLTLRCETGYQISGDITVTCIKNTDFSYEDNPPKCSKLKFEVESKNESSVLS